MPIIFTLQDFIDMERLGILNPSLGLAHEA
jgi:hypothetical protein